MVGTYNYWLVGLSLLVAMYASYTALDLAGRIRSSGRSNVKQFAWLGGGALAMGLGIWSMHFIGMLAFRMPIDLGYDPRITGYSLLIAILVSSFALYVVTRDHLSRTRLAVGALLMGMGVAAMHYTGMAALKMSPSILYRPLLFWLSIAIAVAASWAALWIAFQLRDESQRYVLLKRSGAGFVMGLAIAGMHYTGMSAAMFPVGSICMASGSVSHRWLVFNVTGATLAVLTMTLIYSMLDARYDLQEFRLRSSLEQERLNASLAEANRRLFTMATVDTLTGLPNRASLIEHLNYAIEEAQRTGDHFTVMFMDLDGFKTVNDSLGHTAGDKLLKAFAAQLQEAVRHHDTVARLSGDEFVVLLRELSASQDLAVVANKILKRTQSELLIDGTPLRVTASVGIAVYPDDGETVEELLKNADTAMYEAKHQGRNGYCFFRSEMSMVAARTMEIQRGLSSALENNDFTLSFQPKFVEPFRQMIGAEALIRWQHPVLGEISPREFIPVAERTGQIIPIGSWVIAEVCRHIRLWEQVGLEPVKIAVNLSQKQLSKPNYLDEVLSITKEEGVRPDQLMFEITETVAMRNPEKTSAILQQFQDHGFDIAVDDFGTGYSSLAYLQQFRAKQLKIDRIFTSSLDSGEKQGPAIVGKMIELAHSLQMEVVAEGVETTTQRDKLTELHCDQMQGFLLARPLPGPQFAEFLRATQPQQSHFDLRQWERLISGSALSAGGHQRLAGEPA